MTEVRQKWTPALFPRKQKRRPVAGPALSLFWRSGEGLAEDWSFLEVDLQFHSVGARLGPKRATRSACV
ncbi:hypothetical protein DF3PB_10069 [uncultured Defluviicoccus sp.]|uniref:Uncharacterized protein n=1 Tax=metagenome TaxID=256318 RepID=A0A380T9B4_9ZZZZ|nr:hypothetical protein DF3PB_10069 [uncultured Defluviicoccus sp.]